MTDRPSPPAEVQRYYEQYSEESRLQTAAFQLEFERTKDILLRYLPEAPGPVVDVGGAAGAYSAWLAAQGYEMHLVDAAPRLIQEARTLNATLAKPIASIDVADARALPQPDGSAAAVLVMGPLYHLHEVADRARALDEARRVLTGGGRIVVAAISRFAPAFDGIVHKLAADPAFRRIRDRDLIDGRHVNDTGRIEYFTTAYFHHPDELVTELRAAGFSGVEVLGVEGPGWLMPDFDARWADPVLRADMIDVARKLEREHSVLGVSAHLIAMGTKNGAA